MSEQDKATRIYWVGGSKGGVGKSMMTMATLDYLIGCGTDTSNHDVGNAYHEHILSGLFDLDHADGWIDFLNTCDADRDGAVVVNTAARNNVAVRQHGQTLNASLDELGARLVATTVERREGRSVTLPDLADRVADDLYSQRIALSVAASTLPLGNRAELARWRGEVRKLLGELFVWSVASASSP